MDGWFVIRRQLLCAFRSPIITSIMIAVVFGAAEHIFRFQEEFAPRVSAYVYLQPRRRLEVRERRREKKMERKMSVTNKT